MAGYLYDPRVQTLDSSGATIAGATLTFYASGTTTPQDTFSDEALTVPNSNPVVADGSGRFGPIYLQDLSYTVLSKDADGVLIYTQDNVDGAAINPQLSALVDDTTPQLGGALDTNDFAINESEGTAVASAATTNIWVEDGNTVHVTGTTTITSFDTAPRIGAWRKVIFDDVLTLTDGANLNLPGGANITTAADDFAFVYAETTTLFKVLYFRADGTPVAQNLVKRVNTQTGTVATGTTAFPLDDTIPQNTEGDEYMTLAITPTDAANILYIDIVFVGSQSVANDQIGVALFQDTTANALAVASAFPAGVGYLETISFRHKMTAGTTSSTTFKVRAGNTTGPTTTFNGAGGTQRFGGVAASSITITEVKP
jgi:hypothetical protein